MRKKGDEENRIGDQQGKEDGPLGSGNRQKNLGVAGVGA